MELKLKSYNLQLEEMAGFYMPEFRKFHYLMAAVTGLTMESENLGMC